MTISESKKKANRKWDSTNIKTLSIRLKSNDIIFELIDKAIEKTGMNKVDYIKRALYDRFLKDGIIEDTQLNADQPGRLDTSNSAATGIDSQSDTMRYLLENKRQRELNYQRLLELEEEQKEMPWYDGD